MLCKAVIWLQMFEVLLTIAYGFLGRCLTTMHTTTTVFQMIIHARAARVFVLCGKCPFPFGNWNYLGNVFFFFCVFFVFVLVAFLCFSAFLGFCASLPFCFSAFLLLCFPAFPLLLLLCFSTSPIVCFAALFFKFLLAALPCFRMCLPFLFV